MVSGVKFNKSYIRHRRSMILLALLRAHTVNKEVLAFLAFLDGWNAKTKWLFFYHYEYISGSHKGEPDRDPGIKSDLKSGKCDLVNLPGSACNSSISEHIAVDLLSTCVRVVYPLPLRLRHASTPATRAAHE